MSDNKPIAAVIGHPISHSKSPKLHGHWLQTYEIDGHYVPLDVAPVDLARTLDILPRIGFVGANVTIPHKEAVLEYADLITDRATLIGAANTLIFRKDGKIHADNTDGYGFIQNIRQNAPNWQADAGPALVLGAGGAARAVIAALLEAGVPKLYLSNRTRQKAENLQGDFGKKIEVVEWIKVANYIEDARFIVNTTSLGMVNQPELRIPLDGLNDTQVVTDLVYTPLDTRLLKEARAAGATVIDGLGMLLHQAVPGFERWFGHRPDVTEDLRNKMLG